MDDDVSLRDNLRSQFFALTSIDLENPSEHELARLYAKSLFPEQLKWTLVEIVRQYDSIVAAIQAVKPQLESFKHGEARSIAEAVFELRVSEESDWYLHISRGYDGLIVRLTNHATGEVHFVEEAMPFQFKPERTLCNRASLGLGLWTPSAERYFTLVAAPGDAFDACELLHEIGLLERDVYGFAPTELFRSTMAWFRTLAECWDEASDLCDNQEISVSSC